MVESDANSINKDKRLWFVMRAYKREAEAEEALSGTNGLPYYVPKHYIVQNCQNKKIRRLVPSIPNILFVNASHAEIIAFKKRYNFLQFAIWRKSTGPEYLIVPDSQMDSFIKVSSHYEEDLTYYKPEEINIGKGTRIRILGGKFDGVEGIFVKVKGKRSRQVVVLIGNLSAVSVEVSPDLIQILE